MDSHAPLVVHGEYINFHVAGDVAWIDMVFVPGEKRRLGIGRELVLGVISRLPKDVKLVRIMAADTGSGASNAYWERLGFSYVYRDEPEDYEDAQQMWLGVNGNPAPPQR